MGRAIRYFMWGFQPHFRRSVELSLNAALTSIGLEVEGRVILVGFLRDGEEGWPICVEPESGPLGPDLLGQVSASAQEILRADPDQEIRHSDPDVDANYRRYLADRARRRALEESINRILPGTATFVGPSERVAKYEVHTTILLLDDDLQGVPEVPEHRRPGHAPLANSLPQAVINDVLLRSARSLAMPNPGAGFDALDASTEEIVRRAARAFVEGIAERLGEMFGDLVPNMNAISQQRLEGEAAGGRFLLINPRRAGAEVSVELERPVSLRSHRAVRKLLQVAGSSGVSLLTDGRDVYGLGEVPFNAEDMQYRIVVVGEGKWRLRQGDEPLMDVSQEAPNLPASRLSKAAFVDTTSRLFRREEELNVERLWTSVEIAMRAKHGTLMVVAAAVEEEAARLGDQALRFTPIMPTEAILLGLADIDGAILLSPDGTCHAAGVILDGKAGEHGDAARGARYNSAWRYVDASADSDGATLAIVVSEDGMVDMIPHLRPRIEREVVIDAVDTVERLGTSDPIDYEAFYRAWHQLERVGFYLHEEEVRRANAAVAHVEDVRWSEYQMRVDQRPLEVSADMNEEYFL